MSNRTKVLFSLCFLLSFAWIVYMGILQFANPFDLTDIQNKRYNAYKEYLIANRGNIYDQNGTLLVTSQKYYQIDLDLDALSKFIKKQNKPQNDYYRLVTDIITKNTNLTHEEVLRKLITTKANTVMLSENIDENQLLNIKADLSRLNLNIIVPSFSAIKRVYTKGGLAARLLGVTKGVTDNTSRYNRFTYRLEGLNGIEKAFDKDLLGDYGWREVIYDGRQRLIPIPNKANKPVANGSSLYLTIHSEIQDILEKNLRAGMLSYNAKNAIGVIMNPNTGDVIAMTGINKDDSKLNENQIRSFQNMPVQYLFEPGSTMKPFVSLLAIEKNLVKEDDVFDCKPLTIKYPDSERTIRDDHAIGSATFRDVIVKSSNVGIAKIAEKIGRKDLYKHYYNLGFGNMTSIDLEYESSGSFKKLNDWTGYTLHSVAFGQEMSVTALQLANAYCALANGGYLLKPNIIKQKVSEQGKVYAQTERKVIRTVSTRKAIAQNNTFLLDVVERGTGTSARFNNIKIAGKTGTSEKVVNGRLSSLRTASFAGFFPYENPEYVMVIVYDEPASQYRFGGSSAAVTFKSIAEDILSLPDCTIIPDLRNKDTHFITMPKIVGMKIADAKKLLTKEKIDFKIYNDLAEGYITQQLPLPGVKIATKNKVCLYAQKDKTKDTKAATIAYEKMPNLVGMTIRQAINMSKELQIDLRIQGSGHVVSQTIQPGEKLRLQQSCVVTAR